MRKAAASFCLLSKMPSAQSRIIYAMPATPILQRIRFVPAIRLATRAVAPTEPSIRPCQPIILGSRYQLSKSVQANNPPVAMITFAASSIRSISQPKITNKQRSASSTQVRRLWFPALPLPSPRGLQKQLQPQSHHSATLLYDASFFQ